METCADCGLPNTMLAKLRRLKARAMVQWHLFWLVRELRHWLWMVGYDPRPKCDICGCDWNDGKGHGIHGCAGPIRN